jgi:hypothetical protein
MAIALILAACDAGPPDVVETVEGTAGRADGVIVTFDVIVEGALPQGTPLDGEGLQVSISGRDTTSGLFSRGVVVDEKGLSFSNATSSKPGPFTCEASTCAARLHGYLAGVLGDALEYSIRTAYAPDWDGSSPPDFRLELVETRDTPVNHTTYQVSMPHDGSLVGAVVDLSAISTFSGSPPLGWFGVTYAEVWHSAADQPLFRCVVEGCPNATEILFANDVGGAPSGPARVDGWLAAESDPTYTIVAETGSVNAVTERTSKVVNEYRVTIDHPSRDPGLPLLVDLSWAGEEFDEFMIDDIYAANPLDATAHLAEACLESRCSFVVQRTPPGQITDRSPSGLSVTVVPWESEIGELTISIED